MDAQCGQPTYERRTELYTRWERLARCPGGAMRLYIATWYQVPAETRAAGPSAVLSAAALADKMLRGAALSTKDHATALMWPRGTSDPVLLEQVLRRCFAKQHPAESKSGRVTPSRGSANDKQDKVRSRKTMHPFVLKH